MQEALEDLGVRPDTLTQHEKDQLDHDGFLPLGGILKPDPHNAGGMGYAQLPANVPYAEKDGSTAWIWLLWAAS
jgi:hypothetical protein